jgi:4-amino-4-deoxy-L-arabinose transferase-like glycosyltransferase
VSADTRPIAAIVLAALVLRILLAGALGGGFHFADEASYADAAWRLLEGRGFDPGYVRVPGYPVLLAALALPAPHSVLWLRLAQAALTAAGAVLTFALAGRMAGRMAALAAAAVYALDPLVAVAGGLLYPEATAALFLAAAVLAAVETVRRNSTACAAMTGALLGALALFRPVALVLVPVVAAWIVVAGPIGTARRRAIPAAAVVLACLLALGPWTYRNYQLRGRLVPVSTAGTGVAGSPQAIEGRGLGEVLLADALRDPGRFAGRMAREFGHFWEPFPQRLQTDDPARREALRLKYPWLPVAPFLPQTLRNVVAATASAVEFLLALVGVVDLWRRRRRETVLLLGVILAFALGHALLVGKIRYRVTVLPLVFVFAGAGVAAVWAARSRVRDVDRAEV